MGWGVRLAGGQRGGRDPQSASWERRCRGAGWESEECASGRGREVCGVSERGCGVAQRSRECTCLANRSLAGADMDSGAEYLSGTVAVQCKYSFKWKHSSTVFDGCHWRCCRQIPVLRASPTHSIWGKTVHPSSTQMHTDFCYRSRARAPAPHLPSGTGCSTALRYWLLNCPPVPAAAHLPSGTSCSPALRYWLLTCPR